MKEFESQDTQIAHQVNDWRHVDFHPRKEIAVSFDLSKTPGFDYRYDDEDDYIKIQFTSIETNKFVDFQSLEVLSLKFAKIVELKSRSFEHSAKLKKLDLEGNLIGELGGAKFKRK